MEAAIIVRVEPDLYCGGQPSVDELRALARAGVRTVINIRPDAEFEEYVPARVIGELGMAYAHIPMAGSVDMTRPCIEAFDQELTSARSRGPVFVYCRSGNRVGAAIALAQGWLHGCPAAEAIALGKRACMIGLEPTVAAMLDVGHVAPACGGSTPDSGSGAT